MKNKFKHTILITSTVALLASTNIKADTPAGNNAIVAAIALSTVNILGNYNTAMRALGIPFIAQQALFFPAAAAQANLTASHLVELQSAQNTIDYVFGSITPAANPNAAPITGLPITYSAGVYAAMVPVERTATALAQMRYLTVGSLTATTKFQSPKQALEASTFIRYLADAGDRIMPVPVSTLNAADTISRNKYLNTLANYNAAQSVGLNTLYMLYNERIPLPQLNGESVLSADESLAIQGMDPKWQAQVANMSNVDLLRQSVYEQAYGNYQTFKLRMAIEQLNTNLATTALINQQGAEKAQLLVATQQVAKAATQATTQMKG